MTEESEKEFKINEILIKSARDEDERPYHRKLFDTVVHELKMIKERLSPIK